MTKASKRARPSQLCRTIFQLWSCFFEWTCSRITGKICNTSKYPQNRLFATTTSFLVQILWNFQKLCEMHIQTIKINYLDQKLMLGPFIDIFVSRIHLYPKIGLAFVFWLRRDETVQNRDVFDGKVLKGPLSMVIWPITGYRWFHISNKKFITRKQVVKHDGMECNKSNQ